VTEIPAAQREAPNAPINAFPAHSYPAMLPLMGGPFPPPGAPGFGAPAPSSWGMHGQASGVAAHHGSHSWGVSVGNDAGGAGADAIREGGVTRLVGVDVQSEALASGDGGVLGERPAPGGEEDARRNAFSDADRAAAAGNAIKHPHQHPQPLQSFDGSAAGYGLPGMEAHSAVWWGVPPPYVAYIDPGRFRGPWVPASGSVPGFPSHLAYHPTSPQSSPGQSVSTSMEEDLSAIGAGAGVSAAARRDGPGAPGGASALSAPPAALGGPGAQQSEAGGGKGFVQQPDTFAQRVLRWTGLQPPSQR